MTEIPLTRGMVALVDDEDFERVAQFSWSAVPASHGRTWYAARTDYSGDYPRTVRMHRFILDAPDGLEVDHINHDGLDNRRENLRLATRRQNTWNGRKNANAKARFKGVGEFHGKFRLQVSTGHKPTYFGSFDDEAFAARVYDAIVTRLRGEYAVTNFPTIDPEADAIAARLIAAKGLEVAA